MADNNQDGANNTRKRNREGRARTRTNTLLRRREGKIDIEKLAKRADLSLTECGDLSFMRRHFNKPSMRTFA